MKSHNKLKKKYRKSDKQMMQLYHKCIKHHLSEWELEQFIGLKEDFYEEMLQEKKFNFVTP